MNYNERKFNMDIAAVCGLREAVIADFLRDLQATSDETTYRHGYFWVKMQPENHNRSFTVSD